MRLRSADLRQILRPKMFFNRMSVWEQKVLSGSIAQEYVFCLNKIYGVLESVAYVELIRPL